MATYEKAENKFVTIHGVKHAYRLFGQSQGVPLFLHPHFRGNMDFWDPAFINPQAARRPILLVDITGVGRSEGEVPTKYSTWAQVAIDVAEALGISKLDILGFSMSGFVVQLIALQAPHLVRKIVVAGAGPSAGEGVLASDPEYFSQVASATTEDESRQAFKWTFFSCSDKKQQVGEQWWQHMTSARKDRAPLLGPQGVQNQLAAHRDEGSYDRLDWITIPVLVANGSNDLLVTTENSYVLWKRLVNADAHLHLYPDSGHGFLDEYHDHFSNLVNVFLDEE
ncbi:uncharacterized protein A1O9_00972 [Exophiala aquamarina CBS 119918]|uniref:AB hydrolase-1 domain-containing protein n=1 Tax=Exophiala aquamarina CBS 119918 TaxID=1182545 RepID=A0A072PTB3_9EURO|nr:uncharacterized protein A1O9_00972 [Exophiala aquamarina CBS 119918]KEF62997.1 hypothetical protein A1O9_00972 [Exophiala aquamarina CBS 119918]